MALEILQLNGNLDGEQPINPSGTDHVAGQPAAQSASGLQLALGTSTATVGAVVGLFKNDMRDELLIGPSVGDAPQVGTQPSTILKGSNTVKMTAGTLQNGTAQTPFLLPPTHSPWAQGQHLFVSTGGFWDNAPANANDPPFGQVKKPALTATDSLEADMVSQAPYSSSITT